MRGPDLFYAFVILSFIPFPVHKTDCETGVQTFYTSPPFSGHAWGISGRHGNIPLPLNVYFFALQISLDALPIEVADRSRQLPPAPRRPCLRVGRGITAGLLLTSESILAEILNNA